MDSLLSSLTQYGPGIVLAAIIFLAYERHVTQLQEVIRSNTEALTKVAQVLEQNCEALSLHDQRADRIENGVRHNTEALDRLEKATAARSRTAARKTTE